jgi:hypothetical protein
MGGSPGGSDMGGGGPETKSAEDADYEVVDDK